jgi:hypothetical protein
MLLLQIWPEGQQVVLLQHTWPAAQHVVPQQVAVLAQQ